MSAEIGSVRGLFDPRGSCFNGAALR